MVWRGVAVGWCGVCSLVVGEKGLAYFQVWVLAHVHIRAHALAWGWSSSTRCGTHNIFTGLHKRLVLLQVVLERGDEIAGVGDLRKMRSNVMRVSESARVRDCVRVCV